MSIALVSNLGLDGAFMLSGSSLDQALLCRIACTSSFSPFLFDFFFFVSFPFVAYYFIWYDSPERHTDDEGLAVLAHPGLFLIRVTPMTSADVMGSGINRRPKSTPIPRSDPSRLCQPKLRLLTSKAIYCWPLERSGPHRVVMSNARGCQGSDLCMPDEACRSELLLLALAGPARTRGHLSLQNGRRTLFVSGIAKRARGCSDRCVEFVWALIASGSIDLLRALFHVWFLAGGGQRRRPTDDPMGHISNGSIWSWGNPTIRPKAFVFAAFPLTLPSSNHLCSLVVGILQSSVFFTLASKTSHSQTL